MSGRQEWGLVQVGVTSFGYQCVLEKQKTTTWKEKLHNFVSWNKQTIHGVNAKPDKKWIQQQICLHISAEPSPLAEECGHYDSTKAGEDAADNENQEYLVPSLMPFVQESHFLQLKN